MDLLFCYCTYHIMNLDGYIRMQIPVFQTYVYSKYIYIYIHMYIHISHPSLWLSPQLDLTKDGHGSCNAGLAEFWLALDSTTFLF